MKRFFRALLCYAVFFSINAVGAELGSPVSITPYTNDRFLVVDYKNLFLVGADGQRVLVTPEIPAGKAWNPTGVFYRSGLTYIANYGGHNVIAGEIQNGRFIWKMEFVAPGLRSPEGVAADADIVAVADYDGSNISAFAHDGTQLWRTKLDLAHGVWIEGDFVYATALGADARVAKLSKQTGKELLKVETRDWHNGYIYPTAITTALGSGLVGDLLVVDADSGALVSITKDLKEVGRTGKSSAEFWQRPYSAVAHNGELYVTDTEGNRLRKLADGVLSTFGKDSGQRHIGSPPKYGDKGNPFCAPQEAQVPFTQSLRATLGYQGACLHNDAEGWTSKAIWPVGGPLLRRPPNGIGYAWQFAMDIDGQAFTITGSPNRKMVMVSSGDAYIFVNIPLNYVIWGAPKDATELEQLLAPQIKQEWRRYQDIRWMCGPLPAFIKYGTENREPLAEQLHQLISAKNAKELAQKWLNGEAITQTDIDSITSRGRVFYLDDLAILTMLSNSTPEVEIRKFARCKQLVY